jgi:hypothetical protein
MRRQALGLILPASLALVLGSPLLAQGDPWSRVLPARNWFRPPVADPLEPHFGVSLLKTDLLSRRGPERPLFLLPDQDDSDSDVVAAVALGVTFPIVSLAEWEGGGLVLTGHAGVHSRFRIEYPSRDDMGQDWVVGGGLAGAWDEITGRLRIHHRSSHLGDEFMVVTQAAGGGAQRIEFGGEAIEGMAAYAWEGLRLYGGGSWIFHSNTAAETILAVWGRDDRYTVQLGADGEWFPLKGGRLGFNGGVDWQAAQRTNWRGALALAAGVHARNASMLGFTVRWFSGPSTMGEFFLTDETYLALELSGRF